MQTLEAFGYNRATHQEIVADRLQWVAQSDGQHNLAQDPCLRKRGTER